MASNLSSPVLLIGGSGMLGRTWRELLDSRGVAYRAPAHADVDLVRAETIGPALDGVGLVINCAAWTNVDEAETKEREAAALNADGPGALARACAARGVPLVHYSTDYVFSGEGAHPYRVDDPIAPRGVYARTKAEGEARIRDAKGEHLILRTSWLYAPWAKNFVRTIVGYARQRPELKVVNDQRGRPTSSQGLASTSLALIDRGVRGTLHVSDGGDCTWFDLATEAVKLAGVSCTVRPCTTAEFPRPAPRPAYSVLDLSETERLVGPMRPWRDALADVIKTLE